MKRLLFFLSLINILIFSSCNSNEGMRIKTLKTNFTGKKLESSRGSCVVEYDDIDKLTGKRITEIKPELIFTFTHEKLKQYFTDRPFIKGFGSLSKTSDGLFFLNLTFIVDTKYIKTGYNGISKESMLRISLINGEKVFLNNILNDLGIKNIKKQNITYKAVFPIQKNNLKLLLKSEISSIGVLWNGGFEEYDVYNIDFLMKQYECLQKIN